MTTMTATGHVPSDGFRSRCPACTNFVTEGTAHRCPKGRHRDDFQNPILENDVPPWSHGPLKAKRDQSGESR